MKIELWNKKVEEYKSSNSVFAKMDLYFYSFMGVMIIAVTPFVAVNIYNAIMIVFLMYLDGQIVKMSVERLNELKGVQKDYTKYFNHFMVDMVIYTAICFLYH